MTVTLYHVDGSPFARITRILSREWSVPIRGTALDFPLPDEIFDWTDPRHPITWRGNPTIDALVAATAPAPWPAT